MNLTINDLAKLQPAVQAELCKRSLIEFGEKIGHIVDAEKFRTPSHIRVIAEHLEAVERGDIDRLIIALPPRHGKSMLASKIFPLWCMGRNPHNRLIVCSYGADLAQSFTRSIRNTINTQEYKKIFPLTILADDSQAQNRFDTTAGGSVHGVGVGGAITGKGADIVIIDDPIKNSEELLINFSEYLYYGFNAFTTVTYGDVMPVSPVAKSVSMAMGFISQMYVAIIIAMLVGKYAGQEKKEPGTGDG